jgi:hypothetical protein
MCGAISLYFVFLVIVQFLQFFNIDIEFLDPILKMTELLNQEDASSVFIVEICLNIMFSLMTIYVMSAIASGNETIGFRYALFTYYPQRENETLFNAFMVNVFFMCVAQIGTM